MTTEPEASANPWSLTPREVEVLRAVCHHGNHKLAARSLDISYYTVQEHLSRARIKMPQRTPLQRLIAFDRWDRQQQEQR